MASEKNNDSSSKESSSKDDASVSVSGTKLYIGNLAWATTEEELKAHFGGEAGGVVAATIFHDRFGRAKGSGLVELSTAAEATAAIGQYNGSELGGREIFARYDRPDPRGSSRAARQQAGGAAGGGGGDGAVSGGGRKSKAKRGARRPIDPEEDKATPLTNSLFVRNVAWTTTADALTTHFQQCGTVESAEIMTTDSGRPKGMAVVRYATPEDAAIALERLSGSTLDGREIICHKDKKSAPSAE